ncbi:DUF6506 family protein [Nonomuraea sp. NPDC049152]|uniref:DUF6506 family protein n=1 Tax=Nonomuraea sp. NPDC049152 TaxID=3154350 RepID=UPI003405DA50
MALAHWGFVYTAPGVSPEGHWATVDTDGCRTRLVAVQSAEQAPAVARRLADEGAQLIELCGAFGPVWTARVIEALDGRVPVGAVGYGPETVDQLHAIFSRPGTAGPLPSVATKGCDVRSPVIRPPS